jgi:signal transduction histidine kinase/CheY-like chemotaxis protein
VHPITFFVLAAALALLGLVVLRKRPTEPATRSFALFSLGLAGWVCGIGGLYTGSHTTAWGRLTFASASVIPAAFLSFSWAYPQPGPRRGATMRRAAWASGLGLAGLSLTTSLVLHEGGSVTSEGLTRQPGALYPLFATYFLAVATAGLGVFFMKWRRARGLERAQLQYLGVGLLIAAGGSITSNLLIPLLTGQSRASGAGPLFLLPLLLLVGHGIIRRRLLDLRLVIHRIVAFAAVIAVIWIVSWEALRVLRALPEEPISMPWPAVFLVVVTAICLSAPVAPRIARLIDTYLLRSRPPFDRALQEAARNLSRPLTLEQLTAALRRVLESTLVPEQLMIFTNGSSHDDEPPTPGAVRVAGVSDVDACRAAAWAVRSPVPAVKLLAAPPATGTGPATPEQVLRAAGIEVWIGLGRDLRRHGVVLLGSRPSGEPYLAPAVRFLEDLAEVASMALDIAAYVTERERGEAMLASELHVLEMMAKGASLPTVLDALCLGVERQFPGAFAATMLLDPDGAHLRRGAAPSLPAEYVQAIDGSIVGPQAPCCASVAAYRKEAVTARDFAADPRWTASGEPALAYGLRACWSTPVFAADSSVLGTFSMYYGRPHRLGPDERRVVQRATHIVGIAIERARSEEHLRQTEDQLRQSHRMEALGKLAGGVAHDFNNLLTVIGGRAEMARRKLEPMSQIRKDIDLIHKTAERATALTRQLLAFSRKQVLQPKILDLTTVVGGMAPMLQRVIGEDIALSIDARPGLGYIRADQAQIEQVILNLVVNARDAMPEGGEVRLRLDSVEPDDAFARRHPWMRRGRHVRIVVRDTGTGMDADTRAHLFEPFFTTKDRGKGTGLGLSTVYGIVRQHGGCITVESELGGGSIFTIYLPCVMGVPEPGMAALAPPVGALGAGTILLVEDEEEVRALARDVLEDGGYRVLGASNAAEALRISTQHAGSIDLLVSDVVMPEMAGPELAQRLVASRPDLKVLYISGYTGEALTKHGVLDVAANLLQKPFATGALVQRVRDVLEARAPFHA